MGRELEVTVKLVFNIEVPDTIRTPDKVIAQHLADKLSVDVKWADIRSREMLSSRTISEDPLLSA